MLVVYRRAIKHPDQCSTVQVSQEKLPELGQELSLYFAGELFTGIVCSINYSPVDGIETLVYVGLEYPYSNSIT